LTDEPTPEPHEEERRIDRWLEPLFSDPMLQPLLVVSTVIFVMFGATALLLAVASRRISAMGALAILAVMSADAMRPDLRRRRLGPASRLILALWLLSGLAAIAAVRLGLY